MARFRCATEGQAVEVVFDDGGMNLLSSDALRELRELISSLESSLGGRTVLILRSGRPGLFAAGADMAEMLRFSAAGARDFSALGQETFAEIERLPCITIAAIDGNCFGGALDLILAFDVRIATRRSRFAHPGARLGIVTGFGGTSRWRGLLSRRAANQLFLANRVLSAAEALGLGLVDAVAESPLGLASRLEREDLRKVKQLTLLRRPRDRARLLAMARS